MNVNELLWRFDIIYTWMAHRIILCTWKWMKWYMYMRLEVLSLLQMWCRYCKKKNKKKHFVHDTLCAVLDPQATGLSTMIQTRIIGSSLTNCSWHISIWYIYFGITSSGQCNSIYKMMPSVVFFSISLVWNYYGSPEDQTLHLFFFL